MANNMGNISLGQGLMMLADKIRQNKEEGDLTKALRELMGNNQQVANEVSVPQQGTTMAQIAQGQMPRYTPTGAGSYTAQNDLNAYSGVVDPSISAGNRYTNLIDSARLEYDMAQRNGNEQGMLRANQKAEQARQMAGQEGVSLPYSYRSATAGNYEQGQNERAQIAAMLNNPYSASMGASIPNQMNGQPVTVGGTNVFSYNQLANGQVPQAQVQNNPVNSNAYANPATMVAPSANGGGTGVQIGAGNLATAQTPIVPTLEQTQAKANQIRQNMTGSSIPQNQQYSFNTPNFSSFLRGSMVR